MDKVSYALGIGIGRQLASMGAETLNIDDFAQAVKDAIAGKLQISEQEAQELVQNSSPLRRLGSGSSSREGQSSQGSW